MEDNDVQLQIKKRARRRLVGAVFFVSLVALVLPVLMDHDPRPPVHDVEIRIPGEDDKPFEPAMVAVPVEIPPEKPAPASEAPVLPNARVVAVSPPPASAAVAPAPAVVAPAPARPADKPAVKAPEKPVEKKPQAPPAVANDEARRAAAILAGQSPAPAPAAAGGPHLVLIGAFASQANVDNLRKKLGELGIKTFTEPLDSPQGKKIRVRAGPFPSRDEAEKALEKMKRIGVSGVVAPKP